MKIENSSLKRLYETENSQRTDKNARSGKAQAANGLQGKDQASLSETARLLAKSGLELGDTPEIRQELVDALRGQIESGNYQVPAEDIVRCLLAQFRG